MCCAFITFFTFISILFHPSHHCCMGTCCPNLHHTKSCTSFHLRHRYKLHFRPYFIKKLHFISFQTQIQAAFQIRPYFISFHFISVISFQTQIQAASDQTIFHFISFHFRHFISDTDTSCISDQTIFHFISFHFRHRYKLHFRPYFISFHLCSGIQAQHNNSF
jgi:hypothetical protein